MKMIAQLSGTQFLSSEAKSHLYRLQHGEPVVLVADPDNRHDSYAIKVLHTGQQIGWVARQAPGGLSSNRDFIRARDAGEQDWKDAHLTRSGNSFRVAIGTNR